MSSITTPVPATGAATANATRWSQLIFVIICMVLIANLQYGWTLFVNPINKAHGWSIAAIQFAFSVNGRTMGIASLGEAHTTPR